MYFLSFVFLFSGVAVFILGMLLIKFILQKSFSVKLKKLLMKCTKNRLSGVLTGAFVTICLQSSSASSVLTAAFADEGIISLYGAFWIIVGANLGTTFTGLLTSFPFSDILVVLIILGVILLMVPEKLNATRFGILFSGMGLLFVGMRIMGEASSELIEIPFVDDILISCNSPVSGVLTGAFFTALIQSSSAVTALLQVLGAEGIIGIRQAFYIILGSNIGTCATCLIASAGLCGSAKKVSYMHILYNFAGALVFVLISAIMPFPEFIAGCFSDNISLQIAVINIVFNLLSAVLVLLLPLKQKTFYKNRHCKI